MMTSKHNLFYTLIDLEEINSTNDYLRRLSAESNSKEFTVVKADYQSAGKGQRGNSWESSYGENLLFSVLLYPDFILAKDQFILSMLVSLSIQEVLSQYSGNFSIKWPNDIYWKDKKICGILIENDIIDNYLERSIIGIGININQDSFYTNAPNPISLKTIIQRKTDLWSILEKILLNLHFYYQHLKNNNGQEIHQKYADLLYRKVGYHPYEDKNSQFEAKITEVKPNGMIVLEDREKRKREYAFKEVSFILPK